VIEFTILIVVGLFFRFFVRVYFVEH